MAARLVLAAVGAAALLGTTVTLAAAPARKTAAPAVRNWAKVVAPTPEGGFRIGNPQAPTKLVEYGSLTCSHCAAFAEEGVPKLLQGPVRSGKLSYEFRNFVRDPYDMTAALLSRCAGTANYFPLTDAMFAAQPQWIVRYSNMTEAESKAINALPDTERPMRIAAIGGLDAIAAKDGVTPARAKACLTDKAEITRLLEIRKAADAQYKIAGTPTFILNGVKTEAYDWAALAPLLGAAGS